jgi:pimeloyl-ACP methyl ester carboxylesterase
MKKVLKWIGIILLVVILAGGAGFVIWAENALGPQQIALDALKSGAGVTISQKNGYTVFQPDNQDSGTGFIFYPGGRVDYRSYAPALRKIAEKGYLVVLVPVRLNLAFFDINAAEPVLKDFPLIKYWAIGGHSLGGVAATLFASSHPQVTGIVYWASYPADDKLKNSPMKILSISGSRDGLATPDKIEASKALLPAGAQFVQIQGGDHAQFGAYGPQPGDNPAVISAADQWQQTADATVGLLSTLGK